MASSAALVSIVIPALNESAVIEETIAAALAITGQKEVLVVDGGSTDATAACAARAGARVVSAPRGRGHQQRAGALAARGDVLWFLHADTHPPAESINAIRQALADPKVVAGNFALRFSGSSRAARQLTWAYPHFRRLRLCYGDSGIFVRRSAYDRVGGFAALALFEDLDLVRRLRHVGRFAHLDCTLVTSSRRFEQANFALTFARWTALQMLYWAGVPPQWLSRWYAPVRQAVPNGSRDNSELPG